MAGPGFGLESYPSIEEPAKREVKGILDTVVDDWDNYEVEDIYRSGRLLEVELHHSDKSIVNRHTVTVEIDKNP